jgi:hypothetical protein
MDARPAQVVQQILGHTARFFQGISEDREAGGIERALRKHPVIVGRPGEAGDQSVVPSQYQAVVPNLLAEGVEIWS